MISIATLNELQDGDLRTTIEQAEGILKQRDTDRKAKAGEDLPSCVRLWLNCAGRGRGLRACWLVPKRKLESIPESKLVVDDAKVVLYDMLGGADGFCYFRILKTLGD